DASVFNVPTPGRGISDAFMQAQLLADTLGPPLAKDANDDEIDIALARFAIARDEWFLDIFEATCDMAQHDWDRRAAFLGLRRYQQLASAELSRLKTAGWRGAVTAGAQAPRDTSRLESCGG